jgi:hypothetical protein
MVDALTLHRVTGFTPLLLATYSPIYSPFYRVQKFFAKYKFFAPTKLPTPMISDAAECTTKIRKPTGNMSLNQPPGPTRLGGARVLPPPLADRILFQVDQAKLEDQGLLRHLQECRTDANLDRLDRLCTLGMEEVQKQNGLGTFAIYSLSPNHVPGTHGLAVFALPSTTRNPATVVIQLACRTALTISHARLPARAVVNKNRQIFRVPRLRGAVKGLIGPPRWWWNRQPEACW